MTEFYYPELSKTILDAAYKVHTVLGPGLLESTYEACLELELLQRNCRVQRQVALPVVYESIILPEGYRIDLWVNNSIIIELKSVDAIAEVHFKQILTYLRLSQTKVGYLINFNVASLKEGLFRKVL
ncbi:MAG: GxxExxY protein [Ignavibacteria bacterium]|nr:GxxExxY protein [Ignavibacteria bacterium]